MKKRLIGLLLAAVMVMGSTVSVFAATSTAYWGIATYPDVPDSGSASLYDANAGSTCFVGCTQYSSTVNAPVTFTSTNFLASVSIGGVGTVYAKKRNPQLNSTYTVKYSCPGSGRTLANGKLIG